MAAVIGMPYSPPSPPDTSSSATMSPVYPDRPIRPLPRRSLRARLSPEVADQISLPPAPQPATSVFKNYSGAAVQRNGVRVANPLQEVQTTHADSSGDLELDMNGSYRFKGNIVDSDEEEPIGMVHRLGDYSAKSGMIPINVKGGMNGSYRPSDSMAHSVASSNDSVDGYDSFENTNNKKKRKIPTSGSLGSQPASVSTSLSNDLANITISNTRDIGTSLDGSGDGAGQYYGSGSSAIPVMSPGTGISGAGRGRYGRSSRKDMSGRSPLGVSNGNASNVYQMRRLSATPGGAASGKVHDTSTDHGIISAAIAEAAVLPTTPPQGRENVSLLEQSSSKKSTPSNTQFTFTCESDSSKGMAWPGDRPFPNNEGYPHGPNSAPNLRSNMNQRGFSTQGTQTSPTMASQQGQQPHQQLSSQAPQEPPPKPRRSAAKRYAMAARQRRLQQEYNNTFHATKDEDKWICNFCDYELIYGYPPVALIRQYEIKDSRERKRLAEKRRLLEKAKMKGRKGKKGSKNAAKQNNTGSQQQQPASQHHAQSSDNSPPNQGQDTQSDEYYGEDYEDDPSEPVPTRHEVPSRIPRPVPMQHMQGPQVAQTNAT